MGHLLNGCGQSSSDDSSRNLLLLVVPIFNAGSECDWGRCHEIGRAVATLRREKRGTEAVLMRALVLIRWAS